MLNKPDEINLQRVIRYLCTTGIRRPMTFEKVKAWTKQFSNGPEKLLALLILRNLIYRTSDQLESSLKQALKSAALSFVSSEYINEDIDWRDVLNGKREGLDFYCGPPRHEYTPPGKSGEIIARKLKTYFSASQLRYPETFRTLDPNERYLLVDDGAFTGHQLIDFLNKSDSGEFIRRSSQCGIVVGLAHEEAIKNLALSFPSVPVFFGEKITPQECFISISEGWVKDRTWPYQDISPLDQYTKTVTNAKFEKCFPLGYGNLGCMVAYEHGVPDDSLQLLWDESECWQPLFER